MGVPDLLKAAVVIFGLAILIVVGSTVVARHRRDARGEVDEEDDPMVAIEAAYRAGHMDEAEYRRACQALGRDPDPLAAGLRGGRRPRRPR